MPELVQHRTDYKPSTVYRYDSVLKTHILPELGALELTEVTPQRLSDFRDKLSENLSSKMYRNIYWLLTQLFGLAGDLDLIEKSPVRPSLHRARRISKKEKPRLSSEETLRVLKEIPVEYRLIFLLDVVIAVRAGELLGLLARLSTRAANARNQRQRMARPTRHPEDGVQYTRSSHTVVSCRVTEGAPCGSNIRSRWGFRLRAIGWQTLRSRPSP
ncbi:MAG TPA: N-terminal phage integrase SAM-like domain-containing protein [Blastocatellia bacterium]|nr:N-terminal phage integrase SAM-like domain-containing protein [Blastocatellia bacterium]